MNISFFTADVFTDKTFGGAQIAVIPEAENLNEKPRYWQLNSYRREKLNYNYYSP